MNGEQDPDPATIDAWLAGELSAEEAAAVEKWVADQPDVSEQIGSVALRTSPGRVAFFEDLAVAGSGDDEAPIIEELMANITRSPDVPGLAPLADDAWREVIELTDRDDILGTLGHYEVLEVIAIGGMGIVLRARDPELKRIAALKILAPDLAANATARERFLREARAAATLEHENILPIYGVVDEGVPWFAMRYASGGTLQDRLDRNEVMDIDRLKSIARQVAAALDAAHANGIIHRDIKPANLLFDEDEEQIWVCDFGIARSTEDPGLTYPGAIAGTPKFMSPEQAEGRELDGRSDLFSLGAVLYQCATGELVLRGATTAAVFRELSADEPTRIEMRRQDLPQWFGRLLKNLLAKDRDDRPEDAGSVVRAVDEEHSPQPKRRRRRTRRFAIAVGITAAVLVAAFCLLQVPTVERAANELLAMRYERGFFIADRIGAYGDLEHIVAAARNGDTILLPGGDPVAVDNLLIRKGKSLSFAAAHEDQRPVLTTEIAGGPGLVAQSPIRFLGIDFVVNAKRDGDGVLIVDHTSVQLDDCTFVARRDLLPDHEDIKARTIELRGKADLKVLNCEFDLRHANAITVFGKSGDIQLKDSRIASYYGVDLLGTDAVIEQVDLKLERVTFIGQRFLRSNTRQPSPEVRVEADASQFTCAQPLCWFRTDDVTLVRSRTKWVGSANTFRLGNRLVQISSDDNGVGRKNILPLEWFGDPATPGEAAVITVAETGATFSELKEAVALAPDGATLYLSGHIFIPKGVEVEVKHGKSLNFEPHPKALRRPTVEALDGVFHALFIQGNTSVRGIRFVRRNSGSLIRPLLGIRAGMEAQAVVEDCEFVVRRTPELLNGPFSDGLSITDTGSVVVRRCFFRGGKGLLIAMLENTSAASEVRIEDCVIDCPVGFHLRLRARSSAVKLSLVRSVFYGDTLHTTDPNSLLVPYHLDVKDCLLDLSGGLLQFAERDVDALSGRVVWSGKNNVYREGTWTLQSSQGGGENVAPEKLTLGNFEALCEQLPGSSEVDPQFGVLFESEKLLEPITPEGLRSALREGIDSPAVEALEAFGSRK